VTARRLRIAAAAIVTLAVVAWIVLLVLTRDPWPSNDGLTVLLTVTVMAVGLVITSHQPRNAIGWLFIATAVIGIPDAVVRQYLVLDYRQHGGDLALGAVAVAMRTGTALFPFLLAFPSILLFPDGRVPSRGWRRALIVYIVLATIFTVTQFAGAAVNANTAHPAIDIRGNVPNVSPGSVAGFAWLMTPFFLGFWLGSVVHQARSWRRADGERREQLKWLAAGAGLCVVSSVALVLFGDYASLSSRVIADLAVLGIAAMPVAIGVGILKYRLYDIDRLISRTVAYAIVTGVLAAVFVGIVALATEVLPFSSPVAVTASTLAAAGLFNPLRLRVQRAVDRRFNRRRYDAEATIAALVGQLRGAVDPEAVQVALAGAVSAAVEPAHVYVWTRDVR
jgi:hypothetical protein